MRKQLLFRRLFVALLAFASVLNSKAQTDVTATYLNNPTFTSNAITGWTSIYANVNTPGINYSTYEYYSSATTSSSEQFSFTQPQKVSLPEGVYRITVNGFTRTPNAYSNVIFYGETTDKLYQVDLKTLSSGTTAYGSTPSSMQTASNAFYSSAVSGGYWLNTIDNVIVKDGNLTIGIRNIGQMQCSSSVTSWTIFGNFKIYQLTGTLLQPLLNSKITEAQLLASKNYSNVADLNSAISTAQSIVAANITYADIKTLQNAINTYNLGCMNDASASNPIDATFNIKNASFEDGATPLTLTQAGQTGTTYAISAGGGYFSPKGWSTTIASSGNSWDGATVCDNGIIPIAGSAAITPSNGTYLFESRKRWNSGIITLTQSLASLPQGAYKLSVDLGTGATTTYTGTFTAKVNGSSVFTATPSTAAFSTFTSNNFTIGSGQSLDLSMVMGNATTNDYRIIMDNLKLTYYGTTDPSISAPETSLSLSTSTNSTSINLNGKNLSSDISITVPSSHITLSGTNVTGTSPNYTIAVANANQLNSITATWDKAANVSGNISFTSGTASKTVSVSSSDVESVAMSGITLSSGGLNTPFTAGTTSYTAKVPAGITTTTVSATATPSTLTTVTNSGASISASTSSVTLTGNSYNNANHTSGYTVTWGGNYSVADWAANGSTDATLSLPNVYGWNCSNSTTCWGIAGGSSCRYMDNQTGWTNISSSRFLYLRSDGTGGTSTSSVFTFPIAVEPCKTYTLTYIYAWSGSSNTPNITERISTDQAVTTGNTIKTTLKTCAAAKTFTQSSIEFTVPANTNVVYFSHKYDTNTLVAIADLSLTQNTTASLSTNLNSLIFDHNHLTKTFTVTGNVLSNDITLTAPAGISLSQSTITAANAQCGVTVTATFDDATTISNGTISATSGSLSQNITVNTSVDNACFTPAYTDRTNLIADPYLNQLSNFPNSWGTGTIITGTDAYCGYGSGKVSGAYGGSITTANISWVPSTSYRMRALIKTDGVFQFGLQNSYAVEGNNAATYENQITSTSNSWRQIDFTFTTGASAVAGFTYFNNYGKSGTLGYIDNWELYQVTTPSVTINYLDESNNILKTARTVSSALNIGSSYTALASDTAAFSASATESWIFDKTSVSSVLIVEGANTINLKFNKVNNSILSYSVSTTGNWSSNSVWSRGTVPGAGAQITVNGGTLTIDEDASPSNITVAPGAKLSLNSGINLNASSLIIQSDASGTATFVDADATGKTVTGTIQQYLPTGRNWYVGIPIANGDNSTTASSLTAGGATSVSYWDEPTGAWVNDYAGSLTKGRGYIAVSGSGSATNNISFSGTFNTGSIPVTVTRTVGVTKEGFNLIANPYPSYLNPCDLITASSKMEPTIWYRTKGAAYSFETVNTASGEGTNGVTGYIPPMQAFWVRVKANATDAAQNNSETLTFTNAMRYHANPSGVTTTTLKAPKNIQNMLLRLQVSNGVNADEAIIYANTNASNAYDAYDSHKMSNNSALIPEIYTTVGSEQLVINGLNEIPLNTEIPLGFSNLQSGTNSFKLRASELRNISSDTKVFLLDKSTNAETELTTASDYTFTSDATNTTSRFSVIFKSVGQTTGTADTSDKKAIVYTNNGQIVFVANEVPTGDNNSLMIFDATGRKVADRNITSSVTETNNINTTGVYLVRAIVNGQPYSAKINLNH